jgi:hypothetical protein
MTIEGNGATLQWFDRFRPGNSRLFAIGKVDDENFPKGTGELTLTNVYIKGFHVKGGDGGIGGGGGGLGAGGAIYNEGNLTVENCSFENNGAAGGRGGEKGPHEGGSGAGGGGGLSGNGGQGLFFWGGGGGGGSVGNGGTAGVLFDPADNDGGGGGGGGTLSAGGDGQTQAQGQGGGAGGFRCGGRGGSDGDDGRDAACPGGGGGGASGNTSCWGGLICFADGGQGEFGGGGGGGTGNGGPGGFGGGGGGGYDGHFSVHGGSGGFGGGGGGVTDDSVPISIWRHPGKGGPFGGRAGGSDGGGGGALGGGIFSRNGELKVRNSTFFNNFVTRGERGGGSAANGADAGGAIFSLGKSVEITNSTFSGNQATGSGAGIVVYRHNSSVQFTLNNNIIANNGALECFFTGNVTVKGAGNLIMQNGSGTKPFFACPGVVTTSDPQLLSLQLNSPGNTPTMAILVTSPAAGKADPPTSLPTDQRGVPRPQAGRFDIGAFEASSEDRTTTWNPSDKAPDITLSNGNLVFASLRTVYIGVRSVASASAGKKYWELTARKITTIQASNRYGE